MLTRVRLWLRALGGRARVEHELDDELTFHLEQETALRVQRGVAPDDARRQAIIALGGVEATKERHRDGRGTRWIEELAGDAHLALRALARDPALLVAGMLTLALGIGATTAVFSAVEAVVLRQLPFADPGRLVAVWEENPDRGWVRNWAAPANYFDWREQVAAFEGLAGYTDDPSNLTLVGRGDPQIVRADYVTGNFFDVLGAHAARGTVFRNADTFDHGERPIILSDRLWRTRFGADTAIIGRTLSFGGARPWTVVGVMPASFTFPTSRTDVWLPTLFGAGDRAAVSFRRAHWIRVVGRLAPGTTIETATAQLQTVTKRLEAQYPATNVRMGAGITPLHEWVVGNTRRPLLVLLAAAGVLLLIACANVGNLLLVHANGRARDVALRLALGASRGRVARQAITESLVLSGIGGAGGLALGWAGTRALVTIQPTDLLPVSDIAPDGRVWLVALVLTTASGLAFGIGPALFATRQSPGAALAAGGRTIVGGRARWGRRLVVGEVAMAALLAIGATLLVRSYRNVSRVEPGFDPEGVFTASLSIPASRYDSAAKIVAFYSGLIDELRGLPGVEAAAAVRQLPATSASWSSNLGIRGRPVRDMNADVLHREVSGDYFGVMRVPVRRGRVFTTEDGLGGPPVVVINEALAREYFPGENPVGRQICNDRVPDSASVWRTIVGVVGDEHQASLVQPARPEAFMPLAQAPTRGMTVVVRVQRGQDPASLASPFRAALRGRDSLLAITRSRPMTEVRAEAMSRERFLGALVLVFAVTGVALALVGVFGVLAQLVQSRGREMGIRLALGAQRGQVRWLVVRHAITMLGAGLSMGLVAALGATRTLESMLYGITPTDASTYAMVGLSLIASGALAAAVPAWRASGANPASVLRSD